MVDEARIPEALKAEDQWVCWRGEPRNGKATKVPIDPSTDEYATTSDIDTWSSFDTAFRYYRQAGSVDGIGFMFDQDGPYAGIDFDDCRHPETGDVDEWVVEVIQRLESYTERSPSRTGFHVLVSGAVPDDGNRRGNLEMYDSHRYFTVTGDHVAGTPATVEHRADELQAIHREYVADTDNDPSTIQADGRPDVDGLVETLYVQYISE